MKEGLARTDARNVADPSMTNSPTKLMHPPSTQSFQTIPQNTGQFSNQ
jgi:hypothetical protein